jgi:ribonuclease P protein component
MFKKPHRLAKQTEVKLTFARGRSFFSPCYLVKYLKKPAPALPRFTVVVSTKVSKKAVVRNRQKRVVREVLRQNISKFKPGDYIVTVKPQALRLTGKQAREFLLNFFTQTGLLPRS